MAKTKKAKAKQDASVKKNILKNGFQNINELLKENNINAFELSQIIKADAELSSLVDSVSIVKQLLQDQLLLYLSDGVKEIKNTYVYDDQGTKILKKTEEQISSIPLPILFQFLRAIDKNYVPALDNQDDDDDMDEADIDATLMKLIEDKSNGG